MKLNREKDASESISANAQNKPLISTQGGGAIALRVVPKQWPKMDISRPVSRRKLQKDVCWSWITTKSECKYLDAFYRDLTIREGR